MHPKNKLPSIRKRLQLALVSLLSILLVPADSAASADSFDPVRGKRVLGAALASSAMEHSAGEEFSTPRTPEQLLLMFLINPRYNAYLWRHPETMPSLAERMIEPGFALATYEAALRPESYLHFLKGWTDIERLRSYFEVLDPDVVLAWAGAAMNPAFYGAMVERVAAPGKVRNWTLFALGTRVPEMVWPMANPATWVSWLTLPVNPNTYLQLQGPMRMVNPLQPLVMAGAAMDSGKEALRRFIEPVRLEP